MSEMLIANGYQHKVYPYQYCTVMHMINVIEDIFKAENETANLMRFRKEVIPDLRQIPEKDRSEFPDTEDGDDDRFEYEEELFEKFTSIVQDHVGNWDSNIITYRIDDFPDSYMEENVADEGMFIIYNTTVDAVMYRVYNKYRNGDPFVFWENLWRDFLCKHVHLDRKFVNKFLKGFIPLFKENIKDGFETSPTELCKLYKEDVENDFGDNIEIYSKLMDLCPALELGDTEIKFVDPGDIRWHLIKPAPHGYGYEIQMIEKVWNNYKKGIGEDEDDE